MKDELNNVKSVGFDLDGTLYKLTNEMNDRVRDKISERILQKIPHLENIENARNFFEKTYKEIHSATEVLRKVGYENPGIIMDECLANADILDLIKKNENLNYLFIKLNEKYEVYLLTSSPEKLSLEKLAKIGIDKNLFSKKFYSDTPNIGSKSEGKAFDYVLKKSIYEPSQHIYAGDRRESDILPAKKRDMKTISVHESIKEADFCILDINNLGELLL